MRHLLDTSVLSELRKRRPDPAVAAWAGRTPALDNAISAVTVFEVELGIARLRGRDPRQSLAIQAWLETQLRDFDRRILDVTAAIMRAAAPLHIPNPRPDRDSWIAATAKIHGLTVVTRNIRDFEAMGVPVLSPWEQS